MGDEDMRHEVDREDKHRKPFSQHHHHSCRYLGKRGASESNATMDCQSLQSSLKRVRLSCTPGELRLQRDLRSLVSSEGWNQVEEHCWTFANNGEFAQLKQCSENDPLRLWLRTGYGVSLWIQIPRMYPHRPPVVSRVVHHDSEEENISLTNHSRRTTRHDLNPRLERIVVQEMPPTSSASDGSHPVSMQQALSAVHSPPCHPMSCFKSTVVYNDWSPISRLGDLLRFVLKTLESRNVANDEELKPQTEVGHLPTLPTKINSHCMNVLVHGDSLHVGSVGEQTKEQLMEDADYKVDLDKTFPPNRFLVGYHQSTDGKLMCHMSSTRRQNDACGSMDL